MSFKFIFIAWGVCAIVGFVAGLCYEAKIEPPLMTPFAR